MPPKKSTKKREVKPKKLRQKQKQKQQQNVKVNVTQTGGGASGGGGGSFPVYIPQQTPQQFRDTSGENVKLTGLIQSLENRIANFRPPVVAPVAVQPAPNPVNDSATTTAVFNAPITYNDDLAEEVIREIDQMVLKPKPTAKAPPIFNAPNDNNMTLADRIIPQESGYVSEYGGGETDTPSTRKRKPRKDKGVARGSIKEKYKEVGFQEGIPAGRNIQNEFVMGVEQMRDRQIQPGQMRLVPTEEMMVNAPAQSSSSSAVNFA
jgi:hypothetical protein